MADKPATSSTQSRRLIRGCSRLSRIFRLGFVAAAVGLPFAVVCAQENRDLEQGQLPRPRHRSTESVEQALRGRRSARDYGQEPISLSEVSQLLWAAQGITHEDGYRTAPSAGALYPLEAYLVVDRVRRLEPGVYRYQPQEHRLVPQTEGVFNVQLTGAARNQSSVEYGAAAIVIAGLYERTTRKYGDRGRRHVHMEAGHAAQNIYLQAEAPGLGTVSVGAFDGGAVQQLLKRPKDHRPLYIMPVDKPR